MAATVSNPNGGFADRLETKGNACLKLQNVSGVRGETSRMFKTDPVAVGQWAGREEAAEKPAVPGRRIARLSGPARAAGCRPPRWA